MSAIADFRLIDISKLEVVKSHAIPGKGIFGRVKDGYFDYLDKNAKHLKDYKWPGYVYGTLLVYLEEKGIDLMKSSYDEISEYISTSRNSTYFIFTIEHKLKYLDNLNPINFCENELKDYYNDFNGTNENDVGQAMLDAIAVLFDNIQDVTNRNAILFGIY